MAKDKKKLEHIQVKDNGIKLSNKVGDVLNDAKQILQKNLFEGLLKSSNETNITRYKIAQNNAFRDYSINSRKTIEKAQKEVKTALKQDSSVNLKNNQVNRMSADVNKGLLFLQQDAIKTYQSTLKDVLLHVKAASDLKEQLAKHIESGLNLGVVYKDGKNYQFDSYFEMKARTDIQQDIGKNMINAGQENGVIFYITSFYGDCAPDHADYQGKIYVDEKWESLAPKDRLDEIRSYIDSNKLMTVQEVSEKDPFLTTRPNCRHYFQYISIDEVLGAKTQDDVKDLRQERGLNFGGKYQPDKYKALQQQRANERKIRAEKANVQSLELQKQLEPDNKNLQIMINNSKSNIRAYQANQRELEKQYSNIERRYDREALGNRVTLGTERIVDNQDVKPKVNEPTPTQEQPKVEPIKEDKVIVEEKPKEVEYTNDELGAVESYVSGNTMYINQFLRRHEQLDNQEKELVKDLDSAINKEIVTETKLYRSVDASVIFGNIRESDFESLEDYITMGEDAFDKGSYSQSLLRRSKSIVDGAIDKTITDEGYLSTTLDQKIAIDFQYYTAAEHPIVMELEVPKEEIHGFPAYKHFEIEDEPQKEILLERGLSMKITDVSFVRDEESGTQIYVKAKLTKK